MEDQNRSPSELIGEWLSEDNLMLLAAWRRDGHKLQDIADKIGISIGALTKWRHQHEEIADALRSGKELVDYRVENALLKSALGYTTKEVKVRTVMRFGKSVETVKEVTTKEFAPNVGAIQTWLYNRKPESWRKNRDGEFELNDDDSGIRVVVTRASKQNADNINEEVEYSSGAGAEDGEW